MLLAVDLGNTRLKCGLFAGQTLLHGFRTETLRDGSERHYAEFLLRELELRHIEAPGIQAVILASVVPALTPIVSGALRLAVGRDVVSVGPELATGLTLRGPNPLEVGADRLVNAAAAWSLGREAAVREGRPASSGSLVVDLGTASKFDCVSPEGEFLGGVIAPGVQVSLEGLVARAARLRPVELRAPARVLGVTTVECMQSGLVHGHASLVDGLVAKLRAELPFDCDVIGTGGFADLIAPHCAALQRWEPDLTLIGLQRIHAHAAPPAASYLPKS
ncbi:MAG TPA: type III pantothenate kinase [Polyangiaceae bacterium]|nr:type III pantothenate kinase [Polyangiaceae bacterium]